MTYQPKEATPETLLKELRDEIAGYAPEDDGYILLRPSKAWRIHDGMARLLEVERAAKEHVRVDDDRTFFALRRLAEGDET